MLSSRKLVLAIVCGAAIAVLALPSVGSAALCDWLFGCCRKPACAAPLAVAPAYTPCATQTCGYMPSVVYRAVYRPAAPCNPCVAYQPASCNTCAAPAYAATTYRPAFGWASAPRLVAYTTYQPVVPAVACGSCSAVVANSPCNSCGSGCATVSYGAPVSSCDTCATAAAVVPAAPVMAAPAVAPVAPAVVAPSPAVIVTPNTAAPSPETQQTFEGNRPLPGTEQLKPIPEQPGARFNSMPAPVLPNPGDRSANGAKYTTARVQFVAAPVVSSVADDNGGWQPASE